MYIFIACTALACLWYFRRWFLKTEPLPALATPAFQQVNYEAVVPLAESEELTIELENDFDKEWEMYKPVLIEEADTVLLLEAEKLISQVEAITTSKTDVYGRLRQLVRGFLLLHKTEYYDPINKLIFQLVQSECGIELSEAELAALWK